MIIDPIGSLASEVVTDKNASTERKDGGGSSHAHCPGVHATLSSDAAGVASLVARAMQISGVRQDKVDVLRASVNRGSYALDPGAIALAMLKEQMG